MATAAISPARHLPSLVLFHLLIFAALVPAASASAQERCGERVTLNGRGSATQSFTLTVPEDGIPAKGVIVLLAGGGGDLDLDENGCVRKLGGNTLIRIAPLLRKQGFATAFVDAPSDHKGGDGLGGFRVAREHADDLQLVIRDLRTRTGLPVHLAGSSRGTISVANVASRATGDSVPDSIMLLSPITSGRTGGQKAWVSQTVFDLPLARIAASTLVIAHRDDKCARTPPDKADDILERTDASRERFVQLEGGNSNDPNISPLKACAGRFPHGFGGLDSDVAALVVAFAAGAE